MRTYKNLSFIITSLLFASLFFTACNKDGATSNSDTKSNKKAISTTQFSQLSSKSTGIHFSNNLIDDPLDKDRNVMSFDNYFNGGGVAIGDINNDGLQDVFFIGNEVDNKLYLNKGDMNFEDISKSAKINHGKHWATGVTMADVNADGWMDIYVSQSSNFDRPAAVRKNLLYINNKDNTFTESAATYGLDDDNLSHQAAFWDYDNDGDLDCYVMNSSRYVQIPLGKVLKHLDSDKKYVREASGKLFRNDGGKYTDITEAAGMLHYGFGHNIVVSDINGDGWQDLYVTNDYSVPDFMYINQKNGTFKDEILTRTGQITFYGMGVDIADINNDGHQEIAVVDMAADDHVRDKTLMASMNIPNFWIYVNQLGYQYQYMFNTLQLNNGDGNYSNIAHMSNVGKTDWSWTVLLADYDNDGYNDYYVTNGFRRYARDNDSRNKMKKIKEENNGNVPMEMRKKIYNELPQMKLNNLIFQNDGELHFINKTKEWGVDIPSFSNGATYGDLDNDGDLDLVVSNVDEEAFVFRNNSNNNYLRFQLKGVSNQSPLTGTTIKIHTAKGIQFREYSNTRGYRGSVETNLLHFGLGDLTEVDKVEIKWPSGKTQVLKNIKANQLLVVNEANANNTKLNSNKPTTYFKQEKEIASYIHKESEYDDFELEVLIPHKQSTLGPFFSKGDVNNDGLEDFYIGGAAGHSGQLFVQNKNGKFSKLSSNTWNKDKGQEDQGSLFFDYDGDGDQDLYIVSGTTEFKPGNKKYQDRLYKNNGKGGFTKTVGVLPLFLAHGSKVKAADYDDDGDLDLFVAARGIPQKYPYADQFQLLKNEGGKFTNVSKTVGSEIDKKAMINDFIWIDFNGDKTIDLVTAGEWTAIKFYANKDGKFVDVTDNKINANKTKGWWYTLSSADVDNDGDQDIICGNLGTNTKFKASESMPFNVFADDFDKNGTCDIVLSEDYKGELVPTRGRGCSSAQMPFIKDKFKTYKGFAVASVEDIFGDDGVKNSLNLKVSTFSSMVLINNNGKYTIKNLPSDAQVAPINGIITTDINHDGNIDLIVAGNKFNAEVETPRYDGGVGAVLLGNGKGDFEVSTSQQNGFILNKNVKDIISVKSGNNKSLLIVANNNDAMEVYSMR